MHLWFCDPLYLSAGEVCKEEIHKDGLTAVSEKVEQNAKALDTPRTSEANLKGQ